MNVHLVRHTRPALEGTPCYGRLDADLLPGWREEVAALPGRLPADAVVISSQDRRCQQLAQLLASRSGREPRIEERLQELDFGAWEGLAWADIAHSERVHWAKDVWHRSPPGGETYAALHTRVSAAWQALLLTDADQAVIVGNAGPLRALITIALALPRDSFVRFHLDYGGESLLSDNSGGWRLEYANR